MKGEQLMQAMGKVGGMKYVRSTFMTPPTHFWEVAPETWHMIIETNVNGPFYMTRAVVPHMLQRGRGSIINISMNYETMKRRGFSPYGPSKAALESASAIWAQDLADTGIRVNILLPGGATNTGMIPSGVPDEARARLLQPAIMADPAIFLASDASRALTGRRLVAAEWSPEQPDGRPITDGIGR
jgi:NAD(P)-dependent dehydrogenase (short-subunit alcohol dehydrogenase family)